MEEEEWFRDCNKKEEVNNSREIIGTVLKMLQDVFPREEEQTDTAYQRCMG